MINITTKSGKCIGKISDDMNQDDIIYIEGSPVCLSDVYNNPVLKKKFNDEMKNNTDAIKLKDSTVS